MTSLNWYFCCKLISLSDICLIIKNDRNLASNIICLLRVAVLSIFVSITLTSHHATTLFATFAEPPNLPPHFNRAACKTEPNSSVHRLNVLILSFNIFCHFVDYCKKWICLMLWYSDPVLICLLVVHYLYRESIEWVGAADWWPIGQCASVCQWC